jgi:CDP-glucose 4,6-dehydratase
MLETLKQVYKGKKVFLTGHTGFKGSWLLKMLHALGADVKGYALAPETSDDHYYLINGDSLCTSVYGDLRNREQVIDEIIAYEPDFVFHLAAQPLVRYSYIIPAETFDVNVMGTANVLEGIRQLKKSCFGIFITTDKVYHNNESLYPYREHDKLGGHDPYSASKACAELVIDSYRNSFFNHKYYNEHKKAIAVARAGNVIGGGDWAKDRLLPDIARALGNNETIKIRNPYSVRPWQHVLEPLAGYLQLGAKLFDDPFGFSEAFNFGPYAEDALSVEDMVKLAINHWQQGNYEIINTVDQPHEAGLLKLDISKAIAKVNWRPKMNATAAVATTVQWYKQYYLNKNSIADFTASQISTFLK